GVRHRRALSGALGGIMGPLTQLPQQAMQAGQGADGVRHRRALSGALGGIMGPLTQLPQQAMQAGQGA
ncbi:hypothetical protein HGO75_25145, partial [Mycobacterium tuberculosis]|nr:hypothetical protein [Mycobacterium tuberculosis]